jgi:hypothetical protein
MAYVAGGFSFGPYREAWIAIIGEMMRIAGSGDVGWERLFARVADVGPGEFAAAWSMTAALRMSMTQLIGVTDAPAVEREVRAVLAQLAPGKPVDVMGMRITQTGLVDVPAHDGVQVHGLRSTIDLATVPAAQRSMFEALYGAEGQTVYAGFPKGAVVSSTNPDGLTAVARALDAYAGKAPRLEVSGPLGDLVADARAHHESLVGVVDLAAIMGAVRSLAAGASPAPPAGPPGLALGVGVTDGSIHLRLTTLAGPLRALVGS